MYFGMERRGELSHMLSVGLELLVQSLQISNPSFCFDHLPLVEFVAAAVFINNLLDSVLYPFKEVSCVHSPTQCGADLGCQDPDNIPAQLMAQAPCSRIQRLQPIQKNWCLWLEKAIHKVQYLKDPMAIL